MNRTRSQKPTATQQSSLLNQQARASITVLLMVFIGLPVLAQDPPKYTVYRTGSAITIDGQLDESAWFAAPQFTPFVFPWYASGKKEQTVAKMLWDDEYLYVAYLCQDAHIWAEHVFRGSSVWKDDTVEVFTAPNPDRLNAYFNIEMNVLGIFLDQYHPEGPRGPLDRQWQAQGVQLKTSLLGTLNDDADQDSHWVLEVAIPFKIFIKVAKNTPPQPGDQWRLNLNRLGGKTNEQYSQWTASGTPKPQFHYPQDFGWIAFSAESCPFVSK